MIVTLAFAFFSPAVVDGQSFGGFDIAAGRLSALGAGLYPSIHSFHDSDAVSQMISWNALDWRLVHQGHLPLWNDYSVLGMPELANFESSVFSLPDLVSYLVPLRDAFLVAVAMKLAIAGTGTYLFTRVLGCRPLAGCFAGITFMLSGAFVNWVTWPLSDVYAWAGWICGLAVLVYRAPTRPLRVGGLAVAVAFSIYGGFPEANLLLALGLGAGAVVLVLATAWSRRRISPSGLAGIGAGTVLGAMLAAPLLLPGLQVIAAGHRQSEQGFVGLPLRTTSLFLAQGYFGMPIGLTTSFSLSKWNYFETVAYVGVPAMVLALFALFRNVRRPIVLALAAAIPVTLAISYQPHELPSLQSLLDHFSLLRLTRLGRERTTTGFLVAVLAGIGLETLLARPRARHVTTAWLAASLLVATGVGYLAVDSIRAHLVPPASTARFDSLIWPVALTAVVLIAGVMLAVTRTAPAPGSRAPTGQAPASGSPRPPSRFLRARFSGIAALGLALTVGQAAFLFVAGVGIPTYSKGFYPATAAETALESIVGSTLVGLDSGHPTLLQRTAPVGFYPNVNIGYGVHLFAVHDPLTPSAYYASWPGPAPKPNGGPGLFFPDVDSASLARHYGIGYILAAPGLPAPAGTSHVATLAGEALYRVPNSAQFSFVGSARMSRPASGGSSTPDRVLAATEGQPGSWHLEVAASRPATLVLRVTALPGWHLTVDGRPVRLRTYDGVMESTLVPAGRHELRLWYWPSRLSVGFALAAAALASLAAFWLVMRHRGRGSVDTAPVDDGILPVDGLGDPPDLTPSELLVQ